MTSVSIRKLGVSFGHLKVLDDLDLDVEKGEFIVLLGPSGCGKSTLLNAIAGLLDIDAGQVWIDGKNVTWEEPKDRGIGMVFQSYALYPRMTVEGNLSFGLQGGAACRRTRSSGAWRAPPTLLQIEPLLKRKPAELSGGQRQRVAIGRALVRDVDVFLFDEPLSNLDAKLRDRAARRDQEAASAARLDHDLRHPRPDRGADARRPHRGHAWRRHPAARRRPRRSTSGRSTASSPASSARRR